MKPTTLCAAVAAILLHASPTSAADVVDDDTDSVFEPVVVTAVAPRTPLVFETDPKLPRQPVPASDGADYLKTVPGFTAIRNGGTNGDPVLRGMFGSRLNLMSNDGTMLGACPARMDNPLSYVAPETFDALTVIKGPQSVIWGPGASAGTVRFERRTVRFDEPGWRADASVLAGSWGRHDEVLDVAAGAPRGFVRVTANRSEQDDYDDGDGRRVPSAWQKWNADVEAGWTPDADTRLVATLGRGDGEARYAGRGMDGSQFERESAGLRFEKTRLGGVLDAIEASAYLNHADHVMDNYSLRDPDPTGAMPMPMAANVDRTTQGARLATTWRWREASLVTGLDQQTNRHRNRSGMGVGTYTAEPWVPDARFTNLGAFGELTWTLSTRDRLVAGLRADRATVEDRRRDSGGMMPMPNPTFGVTRRNTLASGFARIERELSAVPSTTVYAGLGRVERFPDYWELFSADTAAMDAINAFASVRPEVTTQLDIGAQFEGEAIRAWASLYAGRVDDYVLFRYTNGGMMGPTSQVVNIDARTWGGELGATWRFAPSWKLDASVAHARGENRSDDRALPQMPPLEGRFAVAWDAGAWSFGALWRVVAGQDHVARDDGNVVGRDLGPSAGFGVFALNTGYRFSEATRLSAGIDNVFDRTYAEHLNLAGNAAFGYPADPVRIHEPGRTLWAKLDVRL